MSVDVNVNFCLLGLTASEEAGYSFKKSLTEFMELSKINKNFSSIIESSPMGNCKQFSTYFGSFIMQCDSKVKAIAERYITNTISNFKTAGYTVKFYTSDEINLSVPESTTQQDVIKCIDFIGDVEIAFIHRHQLNAKHDS